MRGIITDPQAPGGLRLADDLTEPEPAPGEVIVGVRAFSINAGEGRTWPSSPG
jgi:NADPH:quinone reductase-like Zn-dependent oxidoreductase